MHTRSSIRAALVAALLLLVPQFPTTRVAHAQPVDATAAFRGRVGVRRGPDHIRISFAAADDRPPSTRMK